jgi:hypothetical protein
MMTATLAPVAGQLATLPIDPAEAEAAATRMTGEYAGGIAAMRLHLDGLHAASQRIQSAFERVDCDNRGSFNRFELTIGYDRNQVYRRGDDGTDPYAGIFTAFKRNAWRMLVDHLGIKNLMSVAKRDEYEKQLESGDLPEITPAAILDVIFGLAGQVQHFATDAAREVFEILRPATSHWGAQYKTNDAFRVGRRVILSWMVEQAYGGGYRPNYSQEKKLIAVDGVFHLLDGKGPIRDRRAPLIQAINDSQNGRGETDYFRFRCFKNRNLHLEMKRLDLVKQLNGLAVGEFVLGADMAE